MRNGMYPPIDKENMNFSNLTGSGNDTSTANLNRSDNNGTIPQMLMGEVGSKTVFS